jgi:hypothetical protein
MLIYQSLQVLWKNRRVYSIYEHPQFENGHQDNDVYKNELSQR